MRKMLIDIDLLIPFIGGKVEIRREKLHYAFGGKIKSIKIDKKTLAIGLAWRSESHGRVLELHWEQKTNPSKKDLNYSVNSTTGLWIPIGEKRIAMYIPKTRKKPEEILIFYLPEDTFELEFPYCPSF